MTSDALRALACAELEAALSIAEASSPPTAEAVVAVIRLESRAEAFQAVADMLDDEAAAEDSIP